MKIAWFTPFNTKSAIGECSRVIVEELARHCKVDLWVHERANLLETNVKIVHFDAKSVVLNDLHRYDYCVYNMGNYAPYHQEIYDTMKQHPGVVVLHDFIMHHFFMVYHLYERRSNADYIRDMEVTYGPKGRELAMQAVAGAPPIWLSDDIIQYPLFEPILEHAQGVIVHSQFHKQQIAKKFIGDIGVSYLPYRAKEATRTRDALCEQFKITPDRVIALSTGIVHPVKRLEKVIEALASAPEIAKKMTYVVIGGGEATYGDQLRALVNERGLGDVVRFLGYQPEDVLRGFLAAADFTINLRFPNSEGCSLSLIEQLAYANPVIVLNSGVYAEMPDSVALKVDVDDAGPQLRAQLATLVNDTPTRERMGADARAFAAQKFTVEGYARNILDYLSNASHESYQAVRASIKDITDELADIHYPIERGTGNIEPVMQQLMTLVNGLRVETRAATPFKTLGIWLAFEHPVPLHREGMTRFLAYLCRHLIEEHQITCELWCYSFNEESIQLAFKGLFDDPAIAPRVKIVHEKNFRTALAGSRYDHQPEVNVDKNNLYELANNVSNADCFLLGICYLDNAISLTKPVFVPLHDLVIFEHYENFVGNNEPFRPYAKKIKEAVEGFNARQTHFFCNSDHVRREQLMRYIAHVAEERTSVVYLPANIPANIHDRLLPAKETLAGFGITKPYFFYPTQIRHNKNVLTLLKAFKTLRDDGVDAQLVLTGTLEHVPAVHQYFEENVLAPHVLIAKDVSEEALYTLHAHAAATVVPTLFEGGFPWQGLEAMLMDTPVIMSRIDVVTERLAAFAIDAKGLRLFDPYDVTQLAAHMREALGARDVLVHDQKAVKDKLFEYSWVDVAQAYFDKMSERLGSLVAKDPSLHKR